MKILISSLASLNILFSLGNNFFVIKTNDFENSFSQVPKNIVTDYYWNEAKNDFAFYDGYDGGEQTFNTIFYFELPLNKQIPETFVSWSPIDDHQSSATFVTWDDEYFKGRSWREMIEFGFKIHHVDLLKNGKVDFDQILHFSDLQLQNQEKKNDPYFLFAQQWLGLSFFERDHDSYLSVFGYQEVASSSQNGGTVYLNLGTGIRLETANF